MADELDLEQGADDDEENAGSGTRKRGGTRGRPSRDTVSSDLKRSISEGLAELAEWLAGRDPELARTLRDGAPRMAEFLAHHAAKRAGVARAIKFVFAKGGPFAFLRSFGPTVRALGDRVGAWRESRAEEIEGELVDEQDAGAAS